MATDAPNWWEAFGDTGTGPPAPAPPLDPDSLMQDALDAFALILAAEMRHGDADRPRLLALDRLRLDLSGRRYSRGFRPDLAADRLCLHTTLRALDGYDRQQWAPQSWDHFKRAEQLLARALSLLPTATPPDAP